MATGHYAPSAQVVDGVLVLSLPDAISPVVWQMELGKTKASAIEVREEGSAHKLILKTPQADVYHIADYAEREKATDALLTVSTAMRMAQGQLRPEQAKTALIPHPNGGKAEKTKGFWKGRSPLKWFWTGIQWLSTLVVLGVVLVLLINLGKFYLFTYGGGSDEAQMQEMSQRAPAPAPTQQKRPSETVGKPVSGDAFLQDLLAE